MLVIAHRSLVFSAAALFTVLTSAAAAHDVQSTADPSRNQPAIQSDVTPGDNGQDDSIPVPFSALLSVEGADNLQKRYSPALRPGRFAYGRPLGEGQAVAQGRDALLNGALIGAAVGAGIGVAVTHGVRDSDLVFGQYARGALVFAAIGAGVGLGIDALLNRVSSGPTVTPRRVLRKSSRMTSRFFQIAIASVARATAMTRRSPCKPSFAGNGASVDWTPRVSCEGQ